MIDPKNVCLYIPNGLKKFKLQLFERIGRKIETAGGILVRGNPEALTALPPQTVPIVGCSPELRLIIARWRATSRPWIYWDRGYARRVFATWLPRGDNGGYYRWHLNSFQMSRVDESAPSDRWDSLQVKIEPWKKNPGGHIVVACLTPTYELFHGLQGWTDKTLRRLARLTKRQVVVRDKESQRSLQSDLEGAYCLVTHGSNTAVESVICGCPVVCDPDSAASFMGITDLDQVEQARYPDRTKWCHSLAYSQFNETELVDGTLWKLIT